MTPIRTILLALLLLSSQGQAAQRYQANIDQARWELQASPIRCELSHAIPRYGQGSFVYSAGGELSFVLQVLQPVMEDSVANMLSVPPFWRSGLDQKELGQVSLARGLMPFYADRVLAQRMIYELDAGMFPTLVFMDWADKKEEVTVALSSVNFYTTLPQFLDCVGQLVDIGYNDLKKVTVQFTPGKHILSPEAQTSLDNLALYGKYDQKMSIRLNGHTDNIGNQRYNRWLSDQRTLAVSNYLVKSGVPRKQIKRRAFGESKPASSNRYLQGRDLNRRVTVDFERLP